VGHWTSKADYTVVRYRGTVPRAVFRLPDGVEILPKARKKEIYQEAEPELPNIKDAGGVIPASRVVEEIQKTAKDYRQEFLPVNNVMAIIRNTAQFSLWSLIDSHPADVKCWPDPPHVEFANCTFDNPDDVKRFVEGYGFGAGMIHDIPKHESVLKDLAASTGRLVEDYGFDAKKIYGQPFNRLAISVNRLKEDQSFLRRHWSKTAQAHPLKQHFLWSPDDINFVNGRAQIVLSDIWDYILVLFLIDLSRGRLRVCANPSCRRLKYFVQERPDQKYCSTPCKNNVGIRNYLADKLKRDEWNAARRKAANGKPKRIVGPGRWHPVDGEEL
jgi:hypothetical protein